MYIKRVIDDNYSYLIQLRSKRNNNMEDPQCGGRERIFSWRNFHERRIFSKNRTQHFPALFIK